MKKVEWETPTVVRIDVLDGDAQGTYRIDIESYKATPCAGLITIGYIGQTKIKININDIPDYAEHYNASLKGLREQRANLVYTISGILDETRYQREKAFERDCGNIPDYDSETYREAKQRLEDFDVAHPEIIAAIKAEDEKSIAAHVWD